MSANLHFAAYKGKEIAAVFLPLAQLRIQVFRAYPYLYQGSISYEKEYLQTYIEAEKAFLFVVFEGEQMVGATTCIPLSAETSEVQKPFVDAGFDLEKIFYFGESILLPPYRGLGLGHLFFEQREAHALSFGTYQQTCFCAVQRPDNHPARPKDYQPLDAFWTKKGYKIAPQLQSWFDWPDIGSQESTAKPMTYWIKTLF
jgi:GNAT superfamily N-acetyltransferase